VALTVRNTELVAFTGEMRKTKKKFVEKPEIKIQEQSS
jgi:hypothetical protein